MHEEKRDGEKIEQVQDIKVMMSKSQLDTSLGGP